MCYLQVLGIKKGIIIIILIMIKKIIAVLMEKSAKTQTDMEIMVVVRLVP